MMMMRIIMMNNSATVHSNHSSSYSPYGTMAAAADKWRYTVQNITSIFSSEYTLSPGTGSKKKFADFDMVMIVMMMMMIMMMMTGAGGAAGLGGDGDGEASGLWTAQD